MDSLPKIFLPDVIRDWLVLQRSGLSESGKKTRAGRTENTLDRWRIVEALKQQWPDHELQVCEEIASETVIERCARTSKEKQRVEPEMHLSETATQSAWNAKSREVHGNMPRGTKLVHGKLKTISSKEASRMKMKKLSIWPVLD